MARLARTVIAGLPHHVTQRGNRREAIFFEDGDQEIYRDLLAEQTCKAGVEVWAYCLMPNHVHLILTPKRADPDFLPRCTGQGCVCAFLCERRMKIPEPFSSTGNRCCPACSSLVLNSPKDQCTRPNSPLFALEPFLD